MTAYKEIVELAGYTARVAIMIQVFEDCSQGKYQRQEVQKLLASLSLNVLLKTRRRQASTSETRSHALRRRRRAVAYLPNAIVNVILHCKGTAH